MWTVLFWGFSSLPPIFGPLTPHCPDGHDCVEYEASVVEVPIPVANSAIRVNTSLPVQWLCNREVFAILTLSLLCPPLSVLFPEEIVRFEDLHFPPLLLCRQ